MKTNVNIVRRLNDFEVIQRTKDSMFNATELLRQWNTSVKQEKRTDHFLGLSQTKEFLKVLAKEEGLNTRNHADSCESTCYKIQKGNKSKSILDQYWMHPYLFIKFAMWLNPKFEYHVIKFVYDELVKNRHLSGDYYNKLCSLLGQFNDTDFREVGRVLNFVVFNDHEKEKRNSATPEQQDDLQQLERDMCNYIELGFIQSFAQFKQAMRKEWRKRHAQEPKIFSTNT